MVALFLNALILSQLLRVSCEGTHILHYDLVVSFPEMSCNPCFMAGGYIDASFMYYKEDKRSKKYCDLRIKRQEADKIWELEELQEQLKRMLAEIMSQKDQYRSIHILQATFGCETQGNNTAGFWRLGYNGQDFLTMDPVNFKWQACVPSAQSTVTFWEMHGPREDHIKAFLNGICAGRLQGYLENQFMDTGSPNVTITSRTHPMGRTALTCWAFLLFSPMASLAWLCDGKPVQQHTFGPGTILPSGDGTYQTWLSIWVFPGQEPQFTCLLSHRSKNIEVPAFFGHQTRKNDGATSSASSLVASVLTATLVFLVFT